MNFKIFLFSISALLAANLVSTEKVVVCYYGTWATYRPEPGKFDVEDVNVELCTHAVYAFAGIKENGTVVSLDAFLDLPDGRDNFNKFNALKQKNPNLKTILAVGGWNEGSAKYSNMAASPTLRQNFIKSFIEMIQEYGFNGGDLDWEYPGRRDSTNGEADIDNFSTLLKEMRTEFDKHGLTMSAAVSAVGENAKLSYDVPAISKYLDWVNIMAYDMYGAWDSVTGHNAPLFKGEGDEDADTKSLFIVSNAVDYWLGEGCPPEKLVLGVPFYGRTFTLVNADQHGVRSPSNGSGIAGPYTREAGTIGYNEICDIINKESWTVKYDDLAKVPYTYKDKSWVSFDNAESLTEKVKYAIEKKLAGVMIWSVETDDFQGTCGEAYPLLKAINRAFEEIDEPLKTTSTTIAPTSSWASTTMAPTSSWASTTVAPTSSLGSTQSTTTPEYNKDVCQVEGYNPNPEDCSSFIVCVKDLYGGLRPNYFKCPSTLYWDQSLLTCNYAHLVECHAW